MDVFDAVVVIVVVAVAEMVDFKVITIFRLS